MTFPSTSLLPLAGRDLGEFGLSRLRDQAFDAIQALWRKRKEAGVSQKAIADAIGRDEGWVSKNLRAPGNWTLRTIGELVQAMNGEVRIEVIDLQEQTESHSNYDAYQAHRPQAVGVDQARNVATIERGSPSAGVYTITSGYIISSAMVGGSI